MICTFAQYSTSPADWDITISYGNTTPLLGLAERFLPTSNMSVGLTNRANDTYNIRGYLEYFNFTQPNDEQLYYDNIQMEFQLIGLGVDWQYKVFGNATFRGLNIYAGGGANLDFWKNERLAYDVPIDSTDYISVDELSRQEAAWGFNVNAGLSYQLLRHVSLEFNMKYKMLIASLWPALDMQLESIDGLHFFMINLGLNYTW